MADLFGPIFNYLARFVESILPLLLIVSSTSPAWASDYHSPRSAALGGSGHAGPLLNDAIFLNPSFSSFLPTYSIGMNYLSYSGPPNDPNPNSNGEPLFHGRSYSVSIQDGRSDMFQAGVAYSLREDGNYINIGASRAFVRRVGFGIGAKFFFNNPTHTSSNDFMFSSSGIVADWFQTAVVVDNIMQPDEELRHGMAREFIIGLKFNIKKIVLLYIDPHWAPSLPAGQAWGHESGAEFVVMNDFFVRAGAFRNSQVPFESGRGRGFGIGAGWVAPRLSLDYGYQHVIEPREAGVHTFGATVYF